MSFRIGQGYDIHRLVEGRPLILGGITIDYEKGLLVMSGRSVPVNEPNCCAIVKIGEK